MKRDQFIGKKIGNYVLVKLLGKGGMGSVYLAEHPEIGRRVAIKLLATHLCQVNGVSERFLAEAKAITRIDHPNIIDIYDFGRTSEGQLYYVMELLEGDPFRVLMAQKRKMKAPEILPYLEQICAALQAAHDKGVVHRDLKPANIFILDKKPLTLKILDFGIAKLLESDAEEEDNLTRPGMVVGSPTTMAPEQALGNPDKIGNWTDLYSLGVLVYWLLAGRPPFCSKTPVLLLSMHITEKPLPLVNRISTIPHDLSHLVDRCLAKRPADRPKTARHFFEEFRTIVQREMTVQSDDADGPDRQSSDSARPKTDQTPTHRFSGSSNKQKSKSIPPIKTG